MVGLWLLGSLLVGCSGDPTLPPAPPPASQPVNTTATPPFPANGQRPSPSPTAEVAQVRSSLPSPTPPALFPTATTGLTRPAYDFTATAGVPPLQLTPTAIPTGQLAFVQAGNLWLIDDTGGNRRQLTESGDIGSDAALVWNNIRDRVAYIARNGELWLLDLQGKRSLIFSPGRAARPAPAVKLPTPSIGTSPATNLTPRPTEAPKTGLVVTAPVWSPDGRYLAFSYYAQENGPLTGGEVWLTELSGDRLNLTKVGEGFGPNWSGDGRTLAFLSRVEARQGPARPTINATPPGTSLLPPATRPGQSLTEGDREAQALSSAATTITPPGFVTSPITPRITPTTPAAPSSPTNSTPTPFIIYPGGTDSPTQPPTPTLNVEVLPSPPPSPTYPPVYLGTYLVNRIVLYVPASRKLTPLMDSDKLPDAFYDANNTLRSYVPAPLQALWWSPDGRYLAFADRQSVVGVVPVAGPTPVIWTGAPQSYAVSDLQWLPRSDGAFFRVATADGPDASRITLATFNNIAQAPGASGDVTNRNLIKLAVLPGLKSSCPELSPGGNFFSYYDGTTLVLANPDGSIHASYSDSECPAWSPFGRSFATVRKNGDRSIVLTTIDQPQERTLIAARAVDRIFWLRSDPSNLGGQPPAPAPVLLPTIKP